jgi:hypothetical protein
VGTPFNRSYFQLAVSALPTDEIGSGLLLTPTSTERCEHPDDMRARAEKNGYKNGTKYNSLTSQIVYGGLLPTPKATEISETWEQHKERAKKPNAKNRGASLSATVNGMLPTPTATDWKGAYSPEAMVSKDGIDRSLLLRNVYVHTDQDWKQEDGTTSQLSPLFVEEMMGFPPNWTASPFQSGDEKA